MHQMPLAGFGKPPAREVHNLFFALCPGQDVRARISAAARDLGSRFKPQGRWIKPERYHLTLAFLGEFSELPRDLVTRALAAGAHVHAEPFDLVLDVAGSFRNRSVPWWLGTRSTPAGLDSLADALARALSVSGLRSTGARKLVPHVTILRDAGGPLEPLAIEAIRWRVEGFTLIDSRLGRDAAYRELGHWPLGTDR